MIFRQLDSDRDWTFGKGKNNFVVENTAIGLNIQTRLLEWVNDCFFALKQGIDYHNRLEIGQRVNLEQELKVRIVQSYGVIELVSFYTVLDNREFTGFYEVKTIYGQNIQDQIGVNI